MKDKNFYLEQLKSNTDPVKMVGWNNLDKARQRYLAVIEAVKRIKPRFGYSLLDYGCGTGVFSRFVISYLNQAYYYGYDRIREYIEVARIKNPLNRIDGEYIDLVYKGKVNVVVCIGTFSIIGEQTKDQYYKEVIKSLLDLKKITDFNHLILTLHVKDHDEKLYHFSPEKIQEIALRLSMDILTVEPFGDYEEIITMQKKIRGS